MQQYQKKFADFPRFEFPFNLTVYDFDQMDEAVVRYAEGLRQRARAVEEARIVVTHIACETRTTSERFDKTHQDSS